MPERKIAVTLGEDPDTADRFKIGPIPTQVFLDASGKELFRHAGVLGKADIVAKWKELGVDLGPGKSNGGEIR
jgi:thioredoxin 1